MGVSQNWAQKEAGGIIPDTLRVTSSHPHQGSSGKKDSAKIPHWALERLNFSQLPRWETRKGSTDRDYPLPPPDQNMIKGNIGASCGEFQTTQTSRAKQIKFDVFIFDIPITKLWQHPQIKMSWNLPIGKHTKKGTHQSLHTKLKNSYPNCIHFKGMKAGKIKTGNVTMSRALLTQHDHNFFKALYKMENTLQFIKNNYVSKI